MDRGIRAPSEQHFAAQGMAGPRTQEWPGLAEPTGCIEPTTGICFRQLLGSTIASPDKKGLLVYHGPR